MKKHIPNTITCLNLISGCIATYLAFQNKFEWALLMIVVGAVFDFFDGMVARLLHVSSPIGKELDSLADCITFGFAPSAIVFSYLCTLPSHLPYLPFLAFVMAAFSAIRLAKFNLDERQTLGLGALVVGISQSHTYFVGWEWCVLAVLFFCCYLLVSEISMFALKFKTWGWKGNEIKYIFILSCIPLLLLFGIPGIAVVIVWYVVLSVITKKS